MNSLGAGLFARVQAAAFYAQLHREAVAQLPPGTGRDWLDVGCGPGLLCRLAAERGYRVSGADRSSAMLLAARQRPASGLGPIAYLQHDLAQLVASGWQADVVSACSLLVVLPDPALGLRQLVSLLRPGGTLLVVEANQNFGLFSALRHLRTHPQPSGRWPLLLWSLVRGGRALSSGILRSLPHPPRTFDLLGGMVTAWVISADAN